MGTAEAGAAVLRNDRLDRRPFQDRVDERGGVVAVEGVAAPAARGGAPVFGVVRRQPRPGVAVVPLRAALGLLARAHDRLR
ncbi:MAG TPA: hypothetical protein VNK04_24415 [Gemmataceae bacterium]|nr:hypothetical protein [Gemmataceae bacterium]